MAWPERLLGFGGGIALGLVLNSVWERLRLPGYGVKVFQISPGTGGPTPPCEVWMGADDLAQLGIGGTVGAGGLIARSSVTSWLGGGMVTASLARKIYEVYQSPCPAP
jgi:hypothetical protein